MVAKDGVRDRREVARLFVSSLFLLNREKIVCLSENEERVMDRFVISLK